MSGVPAAVRGFLSCAVSVGAVPRSLLGQLYELADSRDLPEEAKAAEVRPNQATEWAAMKAVAAKLGIGAAETCERGPAMAKVDTGQRPGASSGEAAAIKRLKAEDAELRQANEILKAASAAFAADLDRPSKRS